MGSGSQPAPDYGRRRIVAALVLLAGIAAVVLVVVLATKGDGTSGASAQTTTAGAAGDGGSGSDGGGRGGASDGARRDGASGTAGTEGGATGTDDAPATSPTAARDMGKPGPAQPVPILMYHVTTEPPAGAPFPDLYVTRDEFADQMEALAAAGYVGVTQQEVWDAWHRGAPLPRRPVVISIDDGYRSNYLYARPVLRRLGWPAVLNLKVGNLSEPEYGVTGGQVRELIADGWEIDSHTIDHPDLTTVDAATLTREVAKSRRQLQDRFDIPVNFFCYPAGRYDDTVIAAVEAAGYLAATTVNPGLAQTDEASRFALNRVRVNAGVSGATLVDQLAGLGAAH